MGQSEDRQDRIDEQAAEWVVLFGAESVRPAERNAFEHWLAADPRHAVAYQAAAETWRDLGDLKQFYRSGDMPCPPDVPKSASWLAPVLALAACLLLAVGFTLFWYGNPAVMLAADYRTLPGESRAVTLEDGTLAELGSDSAIAVHFSREERRVELLTGMAYFTAAPRKGAETRPFVVSSSNGTATALGTQFSVERLDDAVEVSVAEHSVGVALTDRPSVHPVVLGEGQSVRYSAKAGLETIMQKDVAQATAWRRGKLIFSDVPLSRVIAELNRYRRGRIVISSEALAGLKVSGVFDTADLGNALGRIVSELDLHTISAPPLVTLIY